MKKRNSVFLLCLSLAAIGIMSFSGYRLWKAAQVYAQGNQQYAQLSNQIRAAASAENTQPSIPAMQIDFEALQAINKDAVAWLYCPDTVIDYPVMQASDYDWYLRHLPDGTQNSNGTLFLDYNNAADFSGRLNIIYGHNMKSGSMFGSLTNYKKQEYFEQHPYLYLYTAAQGNYRIELQYGCVIDAGQWRERAFMFEENLTSLVSYAAHNTTFASNVKHTEGDRMIVLSTCSYEFDDARYILVGVLRPANAEHNVDENMQDFR